MLPAPGSRAPDIAFKWVAALAAAMIVVLIVLVGWELYAGSRLAIKKFGPGSCGAREWDPVQDKYGALPFIFGTLVSSLLALLIAVPLGVATALFLTELAPVRLRQPIVMAIEMLAAVPSVIFGLWGIFVLIPWLRDHLFVWLKHSLGFLPLFQRADLRGQHAGGRDHHRDHDPADHHLDLPGDPALGAEPPARGGLCARRDALGGAEDRGPELRAPRACSARRSSASAAPSARRWP